MKNGECEWVLYHSELFHSVILWSTSGIGTIMVWYSVGSLGSHSDFFVVEEDALQKHIWEHYQQ